MIKVINIGVIFASSLFLSGCDQKANSALEKKLEDSNAQISLLKTNIEALKSEVEFKDTIESLSGIAYMTPGAEGYSLIKYDLGILTVQLADVKPYANGSKVTLNFGNTLSASINGMKTTIDWGKVSKEGVAINESAKSKEITFSQTLRAGAWTPVSVVLDGLPPSELGFVRLHNATHTGIQLLR